MNKLTSIRDIISFIKDSDYNSLILDINIEPICFLNNTLISLKFIDYLLYFLDLDLSCYDMINVLDTLLNKYDI